MKTIEIAIGSDTTNIAIGRRGENEATEVVWDVSSLIDTYGEGTATVLVKRPCDTSAYPVTVTQSDSTVTWVVSSTDTYYKGIGAVEIFWYVDDVLAKSIVYSTRVQPDIGNTIEDPPDAYETWVETLSELGATTLANATAAEAAQEAAEEAQSAAETAQSAAESAQSAAETAQEAAETAQASAESASDAAADSATLAESWAVGGTGTRSGEDTDNAAYYAEVAQQGAEESGYAWFAVDTSDGNMYVTVTENLAEDVSFAVNTSNGTLEVTVNG